MLLQLTLIVNFLALAASLWLGLYVVTRSPRRLIAWLTGLTLWSLTGLFLNVLLALNPPPVPVNLPHWVLLFLPFWRAGAFESGASAWLQGWLVTPAIAFWHHATTLMRPGRMNRLRWIRVLLVYGVAAAAILVQLNTRLMFASASGDPLYLNVLKAGPLFPVFAACLLLFTGMSLINLVRSARAAPAAMPRKQLAILAAATLVAGLTGPISFAAVAFGVALPRVILSLLLGSAVILIGYGVAGYSALVEGRVLRRDFIYNAVAVGLVTGLYLFVTRMSVLAYRVPAVAFVFVLMLAIVTHTLVDVARRVLDSVFYRRDTRRLRANLDRLARLAGEQDALDDSLAQTLESLCDSVRATFGLIVLLEEGGIRLAAACRWPASHLPLSPQDLAADDVLPLPPGRFPPPLAEAALLIPLYAEAKQLGVLLLGRPVNSVSYSRSDLELLLYPSDRLADAIRDARREAEHLAQIARLVEASKRPSGGRPEEDSVKGVEDALRNLTSYAYLGEHPLAEWKLAQYRLPAGSRTSLDRGKATYGVLVDAIDKLRPEGRSPGEPPPREWHPYLILHDAYLENMPNRDIMSRLYISEGTFNRTRRAALQAVAKSLEEMESTLGP